MKIINVKEVYNVSQISSSNSKAWEILGELKEGVVGEILYDFKGIELSEPWNNTGFIKFMQDERVYLKVYSDERLKETLELMCSMGNIKTGRVINEDIVAHDDIKPMDKKMLMMVEKALRYIEKDEDNGIGELDVDIIVAQLGSISTVDAIIEAIKRYKEKSGIKKYKLDMGLMDIHVSVIEYIVKKVAELKSVGIEIKVESDDDNVIGLLKTYECMLGKGRYNDKERMGIIKKVIPEGTVGMLSKYKETKSKDSFGRCGDGKPVICRPAIYKGIKEVDGVLYAEFTEYVGTTFMPSMQYELDNDGESHPGLSSKSVVIPLIKLGLCDCFIGELYHFNLPIQLRERDFITTYDYRDDGSIHTVKKSLPEYIKLVLDEFGIVYNRSYLDQSITETYKLLNRSGV